jgi:histidinol-phosphatase
VAHSHLLEVLQFALSLADVAERQILPVFRNCTVTLKSDGTEVTQADRHAEEAMREIIGKRYPEHEVLGEEFGGVQGPVAKPQWILDPVDGTASFALGVPLFGTLIGYVEANEPVVGVANFPALGETIFAAKGLGCWYRLRGETPQRVAVASAVQLDRAFVSACSVFPSDIHPPASGRVYRLSALIPKVRRFRFITDCLQHSLVAQGRIDAAIDLIMHPWDIAALVPCVEEAGGVASDLDGNHTELVWRKSLLTSSNAELHSQIVAKLSGDLLF